MEIKANYRFAVLFVCQILTKYFLTKKFKSFRFLLILIISVNNSILEAQAILPTQHTNFEMPLPVGWTTNISGVTGDSQDCYGNSARLSGVGHYITVNYSGIATGLKYSLKRNGEQAKTILIQESTNGTDWTTISTINNVPQNATEYNNLLSGSSKFARIIMSETSGGSIEADAIQVYNNMVINSCNYCIPFNLGLSTYQISDFSTTDAENNINNLNNGYGANGYSDFTNLKISVIQNNSFTIKAKGFGANHWKIWIDRNNNGNFNDSGEEIYSENINYLENISVPVSTSGLTPGLYRIRITASMLYEIGDSCWSDPYSETEDYSLLILESQDCNGTPDGGTVSVNPDQGTPGSLYTVSATGYTTGTGLSYQWQYRTGTDPWNTSLPVNSYYSDYTAIASEGEGTIVRWRLRVKCNSSNQTALSTLATFTSNISYCVPQYNMGCSTGDRITNIQLNGQTININNTTTCSPNGYGDYTNLPKPDLIKGVHYTIKVTTDSPNPEKEVVRVWIDYNDNGIFENNESIGKTGISGMDGSTHSFTFKAKDFPGNHRMRVRMIRSGIGNIDPCSDANFGETEDYMVSIGLPEDCNGIPDSGYTTVMPDELGIGGEYTVSATSYAIGQGIKYQWQYRINGGIWNESLPIKNNYSDYTAISPAPAETTVEWRLMTLCTTSDLYNYSSTDIFKSKVLFCTPEYSNSCLYGNNISNVKLNGETVNLNNSSGCNSTAYSNYTNLPAADLTAGKPYTISVTTDYEIPKQQEIRIWIDYNDDGNFDENEEIGNTNGFGMEDNTQSFLFNPKNYIGVHRMRVKMVWMGGSDVDPCDEYYYGETEDYMVKINLPSSCSSTPSAGIAIATPNKKAPGESYVVSASGYSVASNLIYQWQYKIDVNPWQTDLPQTSIYSDHIAIAPHIPDTVVKWRLMVQCQSSGLISYSEIANFKSIACNPISINPNFYLKSVQFNGHLNPDTNYPDTDYSPYGYGDYTSLANRAKQVPGGAINLTVQTEGKDAFIKAWVDWNQNGVFDIDEKVYDSGKFRYIESNFGFIVPEDTAPGFYTIRIRSTRKTDDFGPCERLSNGETEDYLFEVISDCNSKITAVNTSSADGFRCGPGAVHLSAEAENANGFSWYSTPFGGTPLQTGSSSEFNTPNISSTTVFFVAAYNNNCESVRRIPVTARIDEIPVVEFEATETEVCGEESSPIKIKATGIKEVVQLFNENFENGLGLFKESAKGYPSDDANWTIQQSPYSPAKPPFINVSTVLNPAEFNGQFASVVTDVGQNSKITRMLFLKNNLDASELSDLQLIFDLYYLPSVENKPGQSRFRVEVNNGYSSGWQMIAEFTEPKGNPGFWSTETISIPENFQTDRLKIRFVIHSKGKQNEPGIKWQGDIAALDNISLYGKREVETDLNWSGVDSSDLFEEDCSTNYSIPTNSVCFKPNDLSLENNESWNLSATVFIPSGCEITGDIQIINNTKIWNPASGDNWTQTWKPSPAVPTADQCVIVKKQVNLNNGTIGLAKNLVVKPNGKLNIRENASLVVSDFIINQAQTEDFVVENNGNLVQLNDDAVNTGQITLEKEFNFSDERKQYNFVSSPLIGQNVKTIYSPSSPTAMEYNEANDHLYSTSGDYTAGKGFSIKEAQSGSNQVTAQFKGEAFNGILNYNLIKSTSGLGYNLIGNPYPSNLDIKQVYENNNSVINPTFYFWDNRSNTTYAQQGGNYDQANYALYNAFSDMGTAAMNPNTSPVKIPTKNVVPGTGYIVQATQTASLNLNNSYRTIQNGESFFGKSAENVDSDKYWLTLTAPSSMTIMTGVTYFEGGNNGFALDDSEGFGSSDDLYSIVDNHQLAIQGKGIFSPNDVIQMGYKAFTPGYYFISIYDSEGVFEGNQSIYLFDKTLNIIHNLTNEPYRFLSRSGEFNNRFEIIYQPFVQNSVLEKSGIEFSNINHQIVIDSYAGQISEIEIFDLNSQSLYRKSAIHSNQFKVDNHQFGHKIVIVLVKTIEGKIVSQKFVLN